MILYDSNDVCRFDVGLMKQSFRGEEYDHIQSVFYSTKGEPATVLRGGSIEMSMELGGDTLESSLTPGSVSFTSDNDDEGDHRYVSVSTGLSRGPQILMVGKETSIELLDEPGRCLAVLGSTTLTTTRTGATENLTPGSLVLFDRNGKVLEKFPR